MKLNKTSSGSITVHTPGVQVDDSTYTLPRKDGNRMQLIAQADSGYVFDHWQSDDANLNGSTDPNLKIPSFPNNVVVELKSQKNSKKNHTLSNDTCQWSFEEIYAYYRPIFIPYLPPPLNFNACFNIELQDGSDIFTGTNNAHERNCRVKLCFTLK